MKNLRLLLTLLAIFLLHSLSAFSQNEDTGDTEEQKTFIKGRRTEFTKLVGGIQEGIRVNYNNEKTNLEGSVARELEQYHSLLQLTASVGTTTNLSQLFNQDVLPTYSITGTYHFLIPRWSIWYFDGAFDNNYEQLKSGAISPNDIDTRTAENTATVFKYKNSIRDRINDGTIKKEQVLYTNKSYTWLSLAVKSDNSKYLFFDDNQGFANQIYEPSYNSWNIKGSISRYRYWNKSDVKWVRYINFRPNFVFYTFSLQYGLNNNISQLGKVTINDILSSSNGGSTTRQSVKTRSAYNGNYREFNTLTPSFDIIISPIKSFALNVFGDYNFIAGNENNQDNFGSIATGVYFYTSDTKSKFNIGAFHKWTKKNNDNSWVRQIGLRTSIPITPDLD